MQITKDSFFGSSLFKSLLGLAFPKLCYICEKSLEEKETHLCSTCLSKLVLNFGPFCPKCSRHVYKQDLICPNCATRRSYLKKICSCFIYTDIFKHILIHLKYYNKPFLLNPLLPFLSKFCNEHFSHIAIDIVTFVPLHWHKLFSREFDQAYLIAKSIASILQIPIEPLLFKKRSTGSQHFLSKREREQNLNNTFNIIPRINIDKKTILLVDDVLTTGSTINECAKILKKNGAKEIYGFTLARGV